MKTKTLALLAAFGCLLPLTACGGGTETTAPESPASPAGGAMSPSGAPSPAGGAMSPSGSPAAGGAASPSPAGSPAAGGAMSPKPSPKTP